MYAVLLYNMHDNEHLSAEESQADKALFTIILTSIFNSRDEAVENQSGISKRDTVFRHILSRLTRVPGKVRSLKVWLFVHTFKRRRDTSPFRGGLSTPHIRKYEAPFTSTMVPVAKFASPEARKATMAAISSGLPTRPRGLC